MDSLGDNFICATDANTRLNIGDKRRKMSGPGGATNATPGPEQREPVREVHTMPDNSQYSDSAPKGNKEQNANWKPIGTLARALVEKAVAQCEK